MSESSTPEGPPIRSFKWIEDTSKGDRIAESGDDFVKVTQQFPAPTDYTSSSKRPGQRTVRFEVKRLSRRVSGATIFHNMTKKLVDVLHKQRPIIDWTKQLTFRSGEIKIGQDDHTKIDFVDVYIRPGNFVLREIMDNLSQFKLQTSDFLVTWLGSEYGFGPIAPEQYILTRFRIPMSFTYEKKFNDVETGITQIMIDFRRSWLDWLTKFDLQGFKIVAYGADIIYFTDSAPFEVLDRIYVLFEMPIQSDGSMNPFEARNIMPYVKVGNGRHFKLEFKGRVACRACRNDARTIHFTSECTCRYCNTYGHITRTCPILTQKYRQKAALKMPPRFEHVPAVDEAKRAAYIARINRRE